MLESLKFVQGAVSLKDFVPELRHFVIKDGRVKGFNGVMALSSPIALDVECAPLAVPMVKAIDRCQDSVGLTLTDNFHLHIASGPFRSYIPCVAVGDYPTIEPMGEIIPVDGGALLEALRVVSPFIGKDATRPWSGGVLLTNGSAYATNNVSLVQYWIGEVLACPVNVPQGAVNEVLRIGEPPLSAQMDKNSLTFHYADGRWIRTQLLSSEWPEVDSLLDVKGNLTDIEPEFFRGLEVIKPFIENENVVYFEDGALKTTPPGGLGTAYEVPGLPEGQYAYPILALLAGVAEKADFTTYPRPAPFRGAGGKLRGVIVGRRP